MQCDLAFTVEEFERLDLFIEKCDLLARSEWIRDQHRVSYSLSVKDGRMTTETRVPPEDLVASTLHRMRPFLLHREPTSFNAIAGLLRKRLENDYFRAVLKKLRRVFRGEELQSMMAIHVTGPDLEDPSRSVTVTLNDFEMFLGWLNSTEYHQDIEARRNLEALTLAMSQDLVRAIFLSMLEEAIGAVFELGELVALVTGHANKGVV